MEQIAELLAPPNYSLVKIAVFVAFCSFALWVVSKQQF